jgi:hypothetical protein
MHFKGEAFMTKKLLLTVIFAIPLVLGVVTAMTGSITTAYADPPDPKPK